MKHMLLSAAMLFAAAVFLTGCKEPQPDAPASVPAETTVPAITGTTVTALTAAETTVTTASKPVTTAVSGTAPAETTAALAEYEHFVAFDNTMLSRPVPAEYLDGTKEVPPAMQPAIDSGSDLLGKLSSVWVDRDTDQVYLCMYFGDSYGFGGETLSVRKEYSFYRINGITGEITLLADDDGSPLRNLHTMAYVGGRLLVSSYHGFYLIDAENGVIVTLDENNNPLEGSAAVAEGKVYLTGPGSAADGSRVNRILEYDPETDVLTELPQDAYPASEKCVTFWEYAVTQSEAWQVDVQDDGDGVRSYRISW